MQKLETLTDKCDDFWYADFDILYLDPQICDAKLLKEKPGRMARLRNQRLPIEDEFFAALTTSLGLTNGNRPSNPTRFRQRGGFGNRFKDDRSLQRRASATIANAVINFQTTERYLERVDEASTRLIVDSGFADADNCGGLAIVDGILIINNQTLHTLPATYGNIQEPRYGGIRRVEAAVGNLPPALLLKQDPLLPLMVDQANFVNWSPTLDNVHALGWSPHTRTVGFLRTAPLEKPYIDVVVILARPCKPTSQLLGDNQPGSTATTIPGTVNAILGDFLRPLLARMTTPLAPSQPGDLSYQDFRQMALPFLLVCACLRLNNETAAGLERGAIVSHAALVKYQETLAELAHYGDSQTQKLTIPRTLDELLPSDQLFIT